MLLIFYLWLITYKTVSHASSVFFFFFFFRDLFQLMMTSLSFCSQILFPLKRVLPSTNFLVYMFSLLDSYALLIVIGRVHTLLNFNTLFNDSEPLDSCFNHSHFAFLFSYERIKYFLCCSQFMFPLFIGNACCGNYMCLSIYT